MESTCNFLLVKVQKFSNSSISLKLYINRMQELPKNAHDELKLSLFDSFGKIKILEFFVFFFLLFFFFVFFSHFWNSIFKKVSFKDFNLTSFYVTLTISYFWIQKVFAQSYSQTNTLSYSEMPTTTEYINQHFKMKMFIMLNSQSFSKTVQSNKINIFILKYWLIYPLKLFDSRR